MRRKKFGAMIMAVVTAVGLLTGCGGSGSDSGVNVQKGDDKTLNVGLSTDIISLDYAYNYQTNTFMVMDNVNDFLLRFDEDGNLAPSLCTSWEAVDELTYVYQIRSDVKFSDGTPMTVEDVVFSMERIKDPQTASNMNFGYVNVASIEATGEWEVTVKLSQPDSCWQYIPATPGGQITSKAYYESHKDNFGNADGKTLGTGAYKVDSWKTGSEVVLSKNEYYWGDEEIQFEKIIFTVISDPSAMQMALDSGQIDFTIVSDTTMNEAYEKSNNCTITAKEGTNDRFIAFNCASGPCADVNLRRAISCCIDVATLTETQYGDYATAANGIMFGEVLYNLDPEEWKTRAAEIEAYDYDLEKAKEYLAASDYDGTTLDVYIRDGDVLTANTAQAMQATCASVGININIVKLPAADYTSHAYGHNLDEDGNREYDMIFYGWIPDYVDPAGYITIFYESINIGEGGSNMASYVNDKVDELCELQRSSTDNKERSEYLLEICELVAEDVPYKTICYPKTMYVTSNRISYDMPGFWLYSFAIADFKLVK